MSIYKKFGVFGITGESFKSNFYIRIIKTKQEVTKMKVIKRATVTCKDYENVFASEKLRAHASKPCNLRDLPCGRNTR